MLLIGSKTKNSINRNVAKQIDEKDIYEIIDINAPFYTKEDQDEKGIPKDIIALYNKINESEKIIIFTPEYNGYFTAFFKNIIDWLSRIERKFVEGKDIYIICVTPGVNGGKSVLKSAEISFEFFGAKKIRTLGIGNYYKRIDENGIINGELRKEILDFLSKK